MASSMGKCSKCGKILKNNIKYTSNGKVYCYDCYKDVADDLVAQESKKTKIYSYIEKLFKVKKLDEYLVDSISRLIKEDKKTEDVETLIKQVNSMMNTFTDDQLDYAKKAIADKDVKKLKMIIASKKVK